MKRISLVVLASSLGLSLAACAIPEDDFPATYAKTLCDRLAECHAADFQETYGDDMDACESDGADGAELVLDLGDLAGETYDEGKGRDCIQELNRAECGDLDNVDCDVWSDE